jgi:Cys-tRNA(Pro) deacylase
VKEKFPATRAIHFLNERQVAFERRLFTYRGLGDVAKNAAKELGIPEEACFKTLVFQSEGKPVIAIVDAAHRVSLSKLTDAVGAHHRVEECSVKDAERYSGYVVGGISPFGTKREMPVFLDEQAILLDRLYINGGSRGFVVILSPQDLVAALGAKVVDLAV